MIYKRGRLIDHVHLGARDLDASRRFYAAVFDALGIPYVDDGERLYADEFYLDAGEGSTVHLAFQARDPQMVQKFYEAALAGSTLLPADPAARRALLRLYALEKAVYELEYERNNRPDWVEIPLRGLVTLCNGNENSPA